jgi:hypothetical protein
VSQVSATASGGIADKAVIRTCESFMHELAHATNVSLCNCCLSILCAYVTFFIDEEKFLVKTVQLGFPAELGAAELQN